MIELSGVRNSWLTLARNCDLCLLAASSCVVFFLEFLEQPDVFDGDHGLVGEGLKQGDLLIAERSNFRAANHDGADGHAFAQ